MTTLITIIASGLTFWVTLVWYLRKLRFEHIEKICRKALARRERKGAAENLTLDSDGIYGSTWRVHNLLTSVELKFEAWIAMSVRGLFLTYGIPSISSVLHKTGGFQNDVQRRYADMELLIREFNENAVDNCIHFNGQPERARKAIERLNAIHNNYGGLILYRDMMYVLSVFMTTPALFMESRWGWRSLTQEEKECVYFHWLDIGNMMNLRVEQNFKCYDDVLRYKYQYEKKFMKYSKTNQVVGYSTVDYFVNGVIWKPMRSIVKPLVLYIMSILQEQEYQARALGLPLRKEVSPTVGICWRSLHKIVYVTLYVIVDLLLSSKAVFYSVFTKQVCDLAAM